MKRLKIIVLLGMAFGLFGSCGGTKSTESIALKNRQFEALKTLVATKYFVFNAETAYPMQSHDVMRVTSVLLRNTGNTAGRISLLGNGDYISIKSDTVQAELAYFGEIRTAGSMNPGDSGISFNGVPSTFEITENEKKQTLRLEFNIKEKIEPYEVIMQLYPNKHASVFINCMNRTSIRYDGMLKELDETKPTSK